jgi:hypothetical protein
LSGLSSSLLSKSGTPNQLRSRLKNELRMLEAKKNKQSNKNITDGLLKL